MQDDLLVADGVEPLGQGARVVNTFVAPRKTFTDILRSAACWLPLVLMCLASIVYASAIDKKVGFANVAQQQMAQNPTQEERMQSMPPEQRAKLVKVTIIGMKVTSYAGIIIICIFFLVEALIIWASFNFILGASTTFGKVFAVVTFAGLPRAFVMPLAAAGLLFGGVGTENFNLRHPIGSDIGYYLTESPKWLQAFGGFFEIFSLWGLVLLTIGMAILARKTIAQSATVVFGWYALIALIVVGFTAAFG